MDDKFEESAFRKDERLEKLENDFDDLTFRVEKLETSGFQEQINNLTNQIKALEDRNLETSRSFAWTAIETLRYKLIQWTLGNQTKYKSFVSYIEQQAAAAMAETKLSLSPLTVEKAFHDKMKQYCLNHKINAFIED